MNSKKDKRETDKKTNVTDIEEILHWIDKQLPKNISKEIDKEEAIKMLDDAAYDYYLFKELLSRNLPENLCYFVHQKTGEVRIMEPHDPEVSRTQYVSHDETPMALVSFEHFTQHYPRTASMILTHPSLRSTSAENQGDL